MSWNSPVTRYHPVYDDQDDSLFHEEKLHGQSYQHPRSQHNSTRNARIAWTIACVSLTLTLFLVMFSLGRWSIEHQRPVFTNVDSNGGLDVSLHRRMYERNRTYGQPSNPQSDALWEAMQPKQEGFMRHPEVAPHRGAFATFHQLHCLNALRTSYWVLYGQSYPEGRAKPVLPEDEFPHMIAPVHMNHCIDLLRNALICNPDLTFELEVIPGSGTTGFETEHYCVNWSKILEFTNKWARWDVEQMIKEGKLNASTPGLITSDFD